MNLKLLATSSSTGGNAVLNLAYIHKYTVLLLVTTVASSYKHYCVLYTILVLLVVLLLCQTYY